MTNLHAKVLLPITVIGSAVMFAAWKNPSAVKATSAATVAAATPAPASNQTVAVTTPLSAVLYFDYQTGYYCKNRLNPDALEQHFTPEQAKEILEKQEEKKRATSGPTVKPIEQPPAIGAASLRTIKVNCVAIKDKADYEIVQAQDSRATMELMATGKAIILAAGSKVTCIKSANIGTIYQVRPKGSSQLWWIPGYVLDFPNDEAVEGD